MALLARVFRRSRAAGSADVCAGLSRAVPELRPPQGPLRIAEGLAGSQSWLRSDNPPRRDTAPGLGTKAGQILNARPLVRNQGGISRSFSTASGLYVPSKSLNGCPAGRLLSSLSTSGISGSTGTKTASGLYTPSTSLTHPAGKMLPPLNQLNFFNPNEMARESWAKPVEYLQERGISRPFIYPAVKPLVAQYFLDLARKLVLLVGRNRKRGYDISDSLHLENLLVSPTYNAIAMKELIYSNVCPDDEAFNGYEAAANVLQEMLKTSFGNHIVDNLCDDLDHAFVVLRRKKPHDGLNCHLATFMNNSGRIVG